MRYIALTLIAIASAISSNPFFDATKAVQFLFATALIIVLSDIAEATWHITRKER